MPHFKSKPRSPFGSLKKGIVARLSVASEPRAYGLRSMLRSSPGTWSPASVAAADMRDIAGRPHDASTGERNDISFFQLTLRRMLRPQIVPPSRKRNERNGKRSSTVHPSSNSPVRASQMPFQLLLGCSFVIDQSSIPPSEFVNMP